MLTLAIACFTFVLGYYIGGHPDDTRAFFTKVADRVRAGVESIRKKKDAP